VGDVLLGAGDSPEAGGPSASVRAPHTAATVMCLSGATSAIGIQAMGRQAHLQLHRAVDADGRLRERLQRLAQMASTVSAASRESRSTLACSA
jgi:hypothetical protein